MVPVFRLLGLAGFVPKVASGATVSMITVTPEVGISTLPALSVALERTVYVPPAGPFQMYCQLVVPLAKYQLEPPSNETSTVFTPLPVPSSAEP